MIVLAKEFWIDTKEYKRLTIELGKLEKGAPLAVMAALNRTLDFTATKVGRLVTAEYAIKVGDVKKTLKKKRASKTNMAAYITSVGHTLSLAHFKFSPKRINTKKIVKVKIKKTGGMKGINTTPKAFVTNTVGANMMQKMHYKALREGMNPTRYIADKEKARENKINVFKREGKSRYPITPLRTLSIPQMIDNEGVMMKISRLANVKLSERITHEINWRLFKAAEATGGK